MNSLVGKVKTPKLTGEGTSSNQLVLLAESEDIANHLIDKVSAEVLRLYGPK